MKSAIFNTVVFLLLLLVVSSGNGQTIQRKSRFIATAQYAGSIGFLSIGAGLTNRKQTIHYEFMYGHVPKAFGGPTDKLTYKFFWYPVSVQLTKDISWKVLSAGLFVAKNFGEQFPLTPSRAKYPRGYYWWAPGLRFHLGFSSALAFKISKKTDRKLMLYFETNSNDRYLTTYFSDSNSKVMSFMDLWQFGSGMKLLF